MMYDLPDMFDAIGTAIRNTLMKPATWIPTGKDPVAVKVGFEAPFLAVDLNGAQVNAVQALASGLVTEFAEAQAGDVLIIGGRAWKLKDAPKPFGRGNLCRMELAGGKLV